MLEIVQLRIATGHRSTPGAMCMTVWRHAEEGPHIPQEPSYRARQMEGAIHFLIDHMLVSSTLKFMVSAGRKNEIFTNICSLSRG